MVMVLLFLEHDVHLPLRTSLGRAPVTRVRTLSAFKPSFLEFFYSIFLVSISIARDSVDWFEGLNVKTQVANPTYFNSVNTYGVHCGGDLHMWESSGWILECDPYGWFQVMHGTPQGIVFFSNDA